MKNYEKYADEIREKIGKDEGEHFCSEFIMPYILKTDSCVDLYCSACHMRQLLWLLEDYEEPEVDWNKVEVDTPILVRAAEEAEWIKRHFAKYENGDVYAWVDGQTSWTGADKIKWKYAKLAKDEEE